MILAIDVGNTNIVIGCIEAGNIRSIVRIQTSIRETEAEYAIKLKQVLEFYGVDPRGFEGAIISSVVPPVTEALRLAVRGITGINGIVVGPGMKTGLNVRIDDPGTLAGDLVVGSVAAIACYGAPAIVLDMGTATTMVVIDKNNCYVGGAILPGVKLSYSALASGTSLLPDISISPPRKSHCHQHRGLHALRRGLRDCRHNRRYDRADGGGAGLCVPRRRNRRPGKRHRALL